jgi:hypothetical protein
VKKDFLVFLGLFGILLLFYRQSLFVFFTQDDFIMLSQFSGSSFLENVLRAFGPPGVAHWRPVDTLYFLISGTLFGRNYFLYHLATLLMHTISAFMIFKIGSKGFTSQRAGITTALIYLTASAFFHSIAWISGNTTAIGFLFFTFAFYFYVQGRKFLSVLFFLTSILASEAMIFGIALYWAWSSFFPKKQTSKRFLAGLTLAIGIFAAFRFLFLTPATTYDAYKFELSPKIIPALKYYLLRIAGFGESGGDLIPSLLVLGSLALVGYRAVFDFIHDDNRKFYIFAIIAILIGLFPFILIPYHLAAYYMNISIWGFAMIFGIAALRNKQLVLASVILMVVASYLNLSVIAQNSWVIKRAQISKSIILEIEKKNEPPGTLIMFGDFQGFDSKEAYITLGTGKAIDWWFREKNYRYCFKFQKNCN